MPTNDFMVFAGDPAANVQAQTDYAATGFVPRYLGFSTGTAFSDQCNKVWRQATMIATMIAQYTCDTIDQDMLDDGSPAGMNALQAHFVSAVTMTARAAIGVNWLPLTGGTLTGPLTVNAVAPQITIQANGNVDADLNMLRPGGHGANITAFDSISRARWQMTMATAEPETGNDAGANFYLSRFHDDGSYIDAPISINRATGVVNFAHMPTWGFGDLPYLRVTGGTVNGPIVVIGNGIDYPNLGGNFIGFGWDGNFNAFVNGTYIGALATTGWVYGVAGNYLPVSGGTIYNYFEANCSVTVDGTLFNRSNVYFSNLSDFANFFDGRTRYRQWAGNWWDGWDGATGRRFWYCYGGPSMQLDGGANLTISGTLHVYGARIVTGDGGCVGVYGGGTSQGMWASGDGLWWGWADTNANPTNGLLRLGNDGVLTNWGGIIEYNWLQVSQWASVGGDLYVNGRIWDNAGRIISQNSSYEPTLCVDNGSYAMGMWAGRSYYGLNVGMVDYYGNPQGMIFLFNPNGTFAAPALYSYSDESMKENIRPSPSFDSLRAICAIDSVAYDWKDFDRSHTPFGVLAGHVKRHLPDVIESQENLGDMIGVLPMLVHAYRAIAQLNAKIDGMTKH